MLGLVNDEHDIHMFNDGNAFIFVCGAVGLYSYPVKFQVKNLLVYGRTHVNTACSQQC